MIIFNTRQQMTWSGVSMEIYVVNFCVWRVLMKHFKNIKLEIIYYNLNIIHYTVLFIMKKYYSL